MRLLRASSLIALIILSLRCGTEVGNGWDSGKGDDGKNQANENPDTTASDGSDIPAASTTVSTLTEVTGYLYESCSHTISGDLETSFNMTYNGEQVAFSFTSDYWASTIDTTEFRSYTNGTSGQWNGSEVLTSSRTCSGSKTTETNQTIDGLSGTFTKYSQEMTTNATTYTLTWWVGTGRGANGKDALVRAELTQGSATVWTVTHDNF